MAMVERENSAKQLHTAYLGFINASIRRKATWLNSEGWRFCQREVEGRPEGDAIQGVEALSKDIVIMLALWPGGEVLRQLT